MNAPASTPRFPGLYPSVVPAVGRPTRVLSYGGGLDSFTMLVDGIDRGELPDVVVFADVTDPDHVDPGEWPQTYDHIQRVVMPLCAAHGIPFAWLSTDVLPIRGARSLYAYLRDMRLMPSRQRRLCTIAAKVERVTDWLEGAMPGAEVEVWIGFEAGEEDRAARDPHAKGKPEKVRRHARAGRRVRPPTTIKRTSRFPLMERGLCRCRATALIEALGYEVPRGSACMFCPFGSRGDFQTCAREEPEAFAASVLLEANCRKTKAGRTVRFSGTEHDPPLAEWARQEWAFKRRAKPCAVCGAAVKAPKYVGENPPPAGVPSRKRLPVVATSKPAPQAAVAHAAPAVARASRRRVSEAQTSFSFA